MELRDRQVVTESFESILPGFIDFLGNQKTVFKITQDGNINEEVKIIVSFTKAMLVGISHVLGALKSTEKEEFAVIMRDEELKPLVEFSVKYRKPENSVDKGSFALGARFRPDEDNVSLNNIEFTENMVVLKIYNTLIDFTKIDMYPQYLVRIGVLIFLYLEKYLNEKTAMDDSADYNIEMPGYITVGMTYSELSEKSILNITPYEEMKRLIKSDVMLAQQSR
ncbi:MAG: hypothetical protein ACRC0G_07220 [Fusobacteriaceae bacterium]